MGKTRRKRVRKGLKTFFGWLWGVVKAPLISKGKEALKKKIRNRTNRR